MAYLLRGAHVVDPQLGLDDVRDVLVDGEKIACVGEGLQPPADAEVVDASGKYLVPGLVDMHVHFRDPGFEYKETIESGARAAVHGGFTDVATMPNTDPVTDNGAEVRYQIDRARHAGFCHVRPIGALTVGEKGETLAEIGDMVMEGAVAFSDDGHGVQSAGMMRTCMEYVSQFDKVVSAHCEIESLTTHGVINEGRASTRLGMFGWPALGEELEIYRDIELCRMTGCALHIAHISTEKGLELVRAAKAEGLPVTCEVTPHHLFLSEDDITDAYDTNLKMNPPLRRASDAEALRAGPGRVPAAHGGGVGLVFNVSKKWGAVQFRAGRAISCVILAVTLLPASWTPWTPWTPLDPLDPPALMLPDQRRIAPFLKRRLRLPRWRPTGLRNGA